MNDYNYLTVGIIFAIFIIASLIYLFFKIQNLKMNINKVNYDTVESSEKKTINDYRDYNIGDSISNMLICNILGQSSKMLICVVKYHNKFSIIDVNQEIETIDQYEEKSLYLNKLDLLIENDNFENDEVYKLKSELAASYYFAIQSKSPDYKSFFNGVEKLISSKVEEHNETMYLQFTNIYTHNVLFLIITFSILLSIVSNSLQDVLILSFKSTIFDIKFDLPNLTNSLIMMIGSILGSTLSIIQRQKEIKHIYFKNKKNVILYIDSQLFLGLATGFIIYWACLAGFINYNPTKNMSAMFIIAILAGTSERYLNSFLKKQEKNLTNAD